MNRDNSVWPQVQAAITKPKRHLFLVGDSAVREGCIVVRRARVAFCGVCGADRIITNVRKWVGWPEGEAPHTGECIACRNTVSVDSSRPTPAA